MLVRLNIALALIVTLGESKAIPGVITTEPFDQALELDNDGKYFLFWNFNDTHVTFEVHVRTRGYVGFGISDNGNMFPADVIVGWVKDGVTHFAVSTKWADIVLILILAIVFVLKCLLFFITWAIGSRCP